MQTETHADRVREHARLEYIKPAQARRESTVRIVAGNVQKAVHLSNRVSLVCQALRSRKFLDDNHLVLEKWEGPPSGMSTTVVFTYRLLNDDPKTSNARPEWAFLKLRGIAKEAFGSLGGGEAFIQQERKRFHEPGHEPGENQ
jgi:hypothetical protein